MDKQARSVKRNATIRECYGIATRGSGKNRINITLDRTCRPDMIMLSYMYCRALTESGQDIAGRLLMPSVVPAFCDAKLVRLFVILSGYVWNGTHWARRFCNLFESGAGNNDEL